MLRLFEVETHEHDRALGSYVISELFDDFRFVGDLSKHEENFSKQRRD